MDEEKRARRRIRYLSPLNAGKVLGHPRYRTRLFFSHYLERSEASVFASAEDGFLYAMHLPGLARLVPIGGAGFRDHAERAGAHLRALGLFGLSAELYGEATTSQAAFAEGRFAISQEAELPEPDKIAFLAFQAEYLASRHLDPRSVVEEGLAGARTPGELRGRLLLALARYELATHQSTDALHEVLGCALEENPRSRRLRHRFFETATSALRRACLGQRACGRLLHAAVRGRRRLRRDVDRARLFWIEGLALTAFGARRLGEKRLRRAAALARRSGLVDEASTIEEHLGQEIPERTTTT